MKNLKRVLIVITIFLLSLFVTSKIADMIFYDYMFVVDMQNEDNYRLTNSYDNGVEFPLKKQGDYYLTNIPEKITGKSFEAKIKLDEKEKRINQVIVNGEELSEDNIIKLTDYSKYDDSYNNLPLFMINRESNIKLPFIIFITLIFTILLSYVVLSKNKKLDNFVYSNTFLKMLRKWDFVILVGVFIITFFITVGCDAKVIANVGNLFAKDIDIYQLQVNTRLITGRTYAEFPYNPLMLCFWGGILSLFRPLTNILPILGNYPYFEVGIIKLFNLLLIFLTLSSLLSFLIDNKIIDKKRAKWIYYLGLFNPVTFYVAILFVQLDTLTLYLIITGTLLLTKLKDNNYLGIVLLSMGLLLKMQILFLLPSVVIAILYIIFYCNKDKASTKIIRLVKSGVIFCLFALITFGLLYVLKTPFYHLEANLEQSERMWFTTIPYSSNTFFFVTLASLAMCTILFVLNIHSKINENNIIMATIINYAVIVFLFSFSIIPTPSIYIITLGAMIMIIALEKDKLKNLIFTLLSTLIILCAMFSDYGDISKIFKNPNNNGYITEYVQKMEYKDSVRFLSMVFTVSSVTMLTYGIYMQKKSIDLIKGGEKNV